MTAVSTYVIGGFLALHGLVHLWYVVLSQGLVQLEEAMGWNGQSWLLSGVLPEGLILNLASVLYVAVAVGFLGGGVGYVLEAEWAPRLLVGSAALSTIVIVAMWDGRFDLLVEKGILGVFINAVVLGWLLVLE